MPQRQEKETDRSGDTEVEIRRQKMPVSKRAKQFMPFSALKGMDELMRLKEIPVYEKRILSDDEAENVNDVLKRLEKGNDIKISYFTNGSLISETGTVTEISEVFRYLRTDEKKVFFDDICEIAVL